MKSLLSGIVLALTLAMPAQARWCASASLIWDGTTATLVCINKHGYMTKIKDFPRRWLPSGSSEVWIDVDGKRDR